MTRMLIFVLALSAQATECEEAGGSEDPSICTGADCAAETQADCETIKKAECENAGLHAQCVTWTCNTSNCYGTCTDCRCVGGGGGVSPFEDISDIYY